MKTVICGLILSLLLVSCGWKEKQEEVNKWWVDNWNSVVSSDVTPIIRDKASALD